MKILIDKFIPYIQGVLEPYAEVRYLAPADFTPAALQDADALIIRTRTQCDETLLAGSRVQFIATATIGFDHIDAAYCAAHGIRWESAPGCNADAVREYVESAIGYVMQDSKSMDQMTLGVVGVGHVGTLVARMGERLGFRVLQNDPPKQEQGLLPDGVSLDRIAEESDIITFHTPLTREGAYPTYHLCSEEFLRKAARCRLLINAARGGVVDEQAWLRRSQESGARSQDIPALVLDCWEGEPHINQEVLSRVALGTFHIAGYSVQGKLNATRMAVQAVARHFGLLPLMDWEPQQPQRLADADQFRLDQDFQALRQHPEQFEALRSRYRLRWINSK